MSARTSIEWCEATWNPVVGCSVVSPGCTNCYAMRDAWRKNTNPKTPQYHGLTKKVNGKPVWTGEIRVVDHAVTKPLRWRKPRMIFVNSMSDLFAAPEHVIAEVYAVMCLADQHIYQVLTKRGERMRDTLMHKGFWEQVDAAANRLAGGQTDFDRTNPPPNVWLGVSTEDQRRANERIPLLLDTPAAVRWISAEPLLGPIDLARVAHWNGNPDHYFHVLEGYVIDPSQSDCGKVDWVVTGGESGPGSRPARPEWFRSLRDQCEAAGVPFFFKQHGDWLWADDLLTFEQAARLAGKRQYEHHSDGGTAIRVGKKRAGKLLDGREHLEFPT